MQTSKKDQMHKQCTLHLVKERLICFLFKWWLLEPASLDFFSFFQIGLVRQWETKHKASSLGLGSLVGKRNLIKNYSNISFCTLSPGSLFTGYRASSGFLQNYIGASLRRRGNLTRCAANADCRLADSHSQNSHFG